jgi:hypothetical protein
MMERLRKRGEMLAERRLALVKVEIGAVLAAELPGDVRISETGEGITLAARGLKARLLADSSLRDIPFLMRAVR